MFRTGVTVACGLLLITACSILKSRSSVAVLAESDDPTMPSALSVGDFGFESGDPNEPAGPPQESALPGQGCLLGSESLCQHPVSFDNSDLWQKAEAGLDFLNGRAPPTNVEERSRRHSDGDRKLGQSRAEHENDLRKVGDFTETSHRYEARRHSSRQESVPLYRRLVAAQRKYLAQQASLARLEAKVRRETQGNDSDNPSAISLAQHNRDVARNIVGPTSRDEDKRIFGDDERGHHLDRQRPQEHLHVRSDHSNTRPSLSVRAILPLTQPPPSVAGKVTSVVSVPPSPPAAVAAVAAVAADELEGVRAVEKAVQTVTKLVGKLKRRVAAVSSPSAAPPPPPPTAAPEPAAAAAMPVVAVPPSWGPVFMAYPSAAAGPTFSSIQSSLPALPAARPAAAGGAGPAVYLLAGGDPAATAAAVVPGGDVETSPAAAWQAPAADAASTWAWSSPAAGAATAEEAGGNDGDDGPNAAAGVGSEFPVAAAATTTQRTSLWGHSRRVAAAAAGGAEEWKPVARWQRTANGRFGRGTASVAAHEDGDASPSDAYRRQLASLVSSTSWRPLSFADADLPGGGGGGGEVGGGGGAATAQLAGLAWRPGGADPARRATALQRLQQAQASALEAVREAQPAAAAAGRVVARLRAEKEAGGGGGGDGETL